MGIPAPLAQFAFSDSGSLIYVPGPALPGQQDLVLFDRRGAPKPLKLPAARYSYPRVSPDGKRIAFETTMENESRLDLRPLRCELAPVG